MKKQLLIFISAITPSITFATTLSTSCPLNHSTIQEEYLTIADDTCPAGYTSVGTTTSCLESTVDTSCIMYAPANTTYTDNTGSYEFEHPCPLE